MHSPDPASPSGEGRPRGLPPAAPGEGAHARALPQPVRVGHPPVLEHELNDDDPRRHLAYLAMSGDRGALEALWEGHRRYAATVIIAHKPSSADTDDLLQDVAATLVSKIHTLSDPGNFLPWLRMVALNVARLAGRRHAGTIVHADSEAIGLNGAVAAGGGGGHAWKEAGPASSGGGVSREASEVAGGVLALAAKLPEEYREPLLLQTLRDLSYRQIARVMNLPETTVETRIARARKMLREAARQQPGLGLSGPGLPGSALGSGSGSAPRSPARV